MNEWPQKADPTLYTITPFLQGLIYLVKNTTGRVCGGEITAQR